MKQITYRIATLQDALDIASRLRDQDRIELEAASGKDSRTTLLLAVAESARTWVAVINGRPECVFGINEASREVGVPWMVGSDAIETHQRALLTDAQSIVEDMQAAYPVLANFVHAENTVAIHWLGRLGFRFLEEVEHGPSKQLFVPFYRSQQQDHV